MGFDAMAEVRGDGRAGEQRIPGGNDSKKSNGLGQRRKSEGWGQPLRVVPTPSLWLHAAGADETAVPGQALIEEVGGMFATRRLFCAIEIVEQ